MAFQIKDFASIAASCINWMRAVTTRVTDFNIGSVVRTMLEAVAAELEELYQQMFVGLKEAIPVSVYNSFSFDALPALPAMGLVRVTISAQAADVVVPAGTIFTASGSPVRYVASQDTTIVAGNTYVDVPVAADTAGVVGNLSAATAFTMAPQVVGFVSAASLTAFASGQDAESDDARKARFASFIASLTRAIGPAIVYGLKQAAVYDANGNETERVKYASVVEPYESDNTQPMGLIKCYVHNGVGSTSVALVSRATDIVNGYYDAAGNPVPGYKAAGTHTEFYAAGDQALAVTATLTAAPGYVKVDLVASATAAIQAYIGGLDIGVAAIRSELIAIAMNVEGVYNFVMSAPAGDTTPAANVKLLPGTITIT